MISKNITFYCTYDGQQLTDKPNVLFFLIKLTTFPNLLTISYHTHVCTSGTAYIRTEESDKMHTVDDKMSNQSNIYSCNMKINDVLSMYVVSYNAHQTLITNSY